MSRVIPKILNGNFSLIERQLHKFFKTTLSDKYQIYFETGHDVYSEIVIIDESSDVIKLNIRDWTLQSNLNDDESIKVKKLDSQLNRLCKDNYLSKFRTISQGFLFTNIDDIQLEQMKKHIKCEGLLLSSDDFTRLLHLNSDNEFKSFLSTKSKHYQTNRSKMTNSELNEIRIAMNSNNVFDKSDYKNIKVLTQDQEQYSQYIPNDNVLITGNAGSGKSIILQAQAKYVHDHVKDAKILFLCYNLVLQSYLKSPNGVFSSYDNIKVSSIKNFVLSNNEKYDFIFIDEGQDFEEHEFKALNGFLDTSNYGHFVIAADGGQNIYGRETSLENVNIEFKDENLIHLTTNFRITKEISNVAEGYLRDRALNIKASTNPLDMTYISSVERHFYEGDQPLLKKCSNEAEEMSFIVSEIKKLIKKQVPLNEICIIVSQSNMEERAQKIINGCFKLQSVLNSREYNPNNHAVMLTTPHSSKGLEFDYVFYCWFYDGNAKASDGFKKSAYVAMTRAKKKLTITYSVSNEIIRSIENAYNRKIKKVQLSSLYKVEDAAFFEQRLKDLEAALKLVSNDNTSDHLKDALKLKDQRILELENEVKHVKGLLKASQVKKHMPLIDEEKSKKRSKKIRNYLFISILIVFLSLVLWVQAELKKGEDVAQEPEEAQQEVVEEINEFILVRFVVDSFEKEGITSSYGELIGSAGLPEKGYYGLGSVIEIKKIDEDVFIDYCIYHGNNYNTIDFENPLEGNIMLKQNLSINFSNEYVRVECIDDKILGNQINDETSKINSTYQYNYTHETQSGEFR